MGAPMAGYGAAATGLGVGMNAIGQSQAMSAMRDAYRHQNALQAGYDDQLRRKMAEMIAGINPNGIVGAETTNAMMPKLNNQATSMAAAIRAHTGKKTGGSAGGNESRARVMAGISPTLADALRSGKLAALLAGLNQGGQNMNQRSREFGLNLGNIRNDAQRMAAVGPLWEQAAQMKGGTLRQLGNLFQLGGQGAMMYGMSQAPQLGSYESYAPTNPELIEGVQSNLRPDLMDYQAPIDFTPDGLNPVRPYGIG